MEIRFLLEKSCLVTEPRRQFLRRTKPPALDTSTVEVTSQQEDTKKVQVPRGPSKFSRNETRRFNANGGARRTERPTRNFVRRRPEGSVTTSTASPSASSTSSTVTRRPFRIASRRRPSVTTSTQATTTTTAATTTLVLESDEFLQDIGDIDAIEDPTLEPRVPKNPLKTQRRPLVNLKEATVRSTDKSTDQNPSATNEETKRQSKKYSSTFRQNQLDGLLKKEESTTTIDDNETALAIATHQLITAPLPIINDYDEPQTKTTQTDRTTDYTISLTPTDITSTFGQYTTTRVKDNSDIDTGKVTFEYPRTMFEATHRPTNDYEFTTPGPTKTFATLDVTKVFATPDVTKVFGTPEVTGYTGYTGIQRGTVKYSEFATVPSPTLGYNRYPTRPSQERNQFTREYLLESPVTKTYDDEYQYLSPTTPQSPRKVFRKKLQRRISTTLRPTVAALSETNISPDGRAFSPRFTSAYDPKVTSTTYEPKMTSPKTNDPTTTSSRTYLPRVTKPSGFVPQVTAANEYWPEGNDKDYLPKVTAEAFAEITSRNYVPEVTTRYVPEVTSRPYVPEVTARYVTEVTSQQYVPEVTSIRNYSPEESTTRNYSPEVSSTRNHSPEINSARNYSPEISSTRNYSPDISSTRNYSPLESTTKTYSPQVSSTRNYSPKDSPTRNHSPQVSSTRNYSPEVTTPRTVKPKVTTRKPFEKKKTYKPVVNFDYYDDSAEKIALKYAEGTKVIYHGKGSVECLDVGNFPHPSSCKKFISCARMEFGSLLGWEYVCPKGLSFDPVGGICNWSAGLGCDEKDI